MTLHDQTIEKILDRLLTGEKVEVIAQDFPESKEEIVAYEKTMRPFIAFRAVHPTEDGLRAALSSLEAAKPARATPSPFFFQRFTQISFIYRSAFVLPLLLVVLVASGFYLLPKKGAAPVAPGVVATTQTSESTVDSNASTLSITAAKPSASDTRSMKTMSLSATSAPVPAPELPKDSSLAGIYGPELSHDATAVNADTTQAQTASDDSAATASYAKAYDPQSF